MAAAATSISPSSVFAGNPKVKNPFTVILGAGLAGLGAAKKLKESGADYLILEARKRTGGRVFTHYDKGFDGLTLELGAEWIGEHHTEIQKLNNDHQLKMLDHRFDTRLMLGDNYLQPTEWSFDESHTRFEAALRIFKASPEKALKPLDKLDYWRYLNNMGVSNDYLEMRELMDSTDFGETIRNVSAYAALSEYAESSVKNEMDLWTEGGNSNMIKTLESIVGIEKIKLDHTVSEVNQKGKKITVKCTNGFTIECDKVICTLPTFAVNKIKWYPLFSTSRQDALNALQYCRIIKTSILFTERFWKDEAFDMITDSLGHYFFHSTKLQPGTKGILTSYAIGDKAHVISKMDRDKKMKELTHCLQPAFGNVLPYAENIVSYYWGSDVHTQGAYAIYDTDQWFNHRLEIAEPHKNVFFAGEHLADWQGFMEGAYVSGMQAASDVLK